MKKRAKMKPLMRGGGMAMMKKNKMKRGGSVKKKGKSMKKRAKKKRQCHYEKVNQTRQSVAT